MDWPVGSEGVDIEAWAESAAHIYWWPLLAWAAGVVILLFLAVLITSSPVRRRFWCEQAGREVDVAFEEDGPPALRRYIAVVSCTAFSPSTLVQCHRACLDRDPPTLEIGRQPRAPAACALIRHNRDTRTSYCNLRCVHCCHKETVRPRRHMEPGLWNKIVEEVGRESPECELWPTFYGEALIVGRNRERRTETQPCFLRPASDHLVVAETRALDVTRAYSTRTRTSTTSD